METITVKVNFTVKFSPECDPKHQAQVLDNYFNAKGVSFNKEDLTITI